MTMPAPRNPSRVLILAALVAASAPALAAGQTTPATVPPGVAAPPSGGPGPAQAEPGSELRVWLVTAGPGDIVWERYGHNALRVLDTRTGYDVSYNWGIFSFGEPVDFIIRFLQGRMLYMMAPLDTRAMFAAYARDNREVVLQELDLTPAEKLELVDFAENNALPENRDYRYHYFLDNCSTRVRDLLDLVLDGQLESAYGERQTEMSYRWHTRRLTQVDPFIFAGMDALLGTPTDAELTVWDEMFLPLTLRDEIRDLDIRRPDGSVRALVLSDEVAVPSTRGPEATAPPRWLLRFLSLGLLVGVVFASLSLASVHGATTRRRLVLAVASAWMGLFGVLGLILVGLLFTDHTFAAWNENLFLANPLLLFVAVALPLSRIDPVWRERALQAITAGAAIAVVGLLWQVVPLSQQQNGIFFALLLPGHLGLAWGLRGMRGHTPDA